MLGATAGISQQVAIDSTIAGKTSHIYGSFGVDSGCLEAILNKL
jgi:hypothetical protein